LKSHLSRFWSRSQQHGRPVSRRRRWLGFVLLVLLLTGFGAYRRLTDEARLHVYAERWLEQFSGGEVTIEKVRLDLFKGLHLVGVTVATPAEDNFDPADNSLQARTVFRAETLFLRLRPMSILLGDLVVPEIVAINPEVTLAHRIAAGQWNWQVMFAHRKKGQLRGQIRLPVIRLRRARLIQHRLDERGRIYGEPQRIWAQAQPHPDRPDVYVVEVTKLFDSPDTDELESEKSQIELNMRTFAVSGDLPSISLDELLLAAPAEVTRWLDVLALHGYIRAEDFSYEPNVSRSATLNLRDAGVSIPVNTQEQSLPAEQRYLRFEHVGGNVRFEGLKASVELEGRFHGRPITVKGALVLSDEDKAYFSGIGFDLSLAITDMRLPRDDEDTDPAERRFVQNLSEVTKFVEDFDGKGLVDLAIRLRKSPGPNAQVEFAEGTLEFKQSSARYIKFPYRQHNLTGTVYFRPDGKVELKNIIGTHGPGRIVTNGLLGGRVSREGDLSVTGEGIELDDELLDCFDPRDRRLCRQFNANVHADVQVHMLRDAGPLDKSAPPWRSEIDIKFIDGSVNMAWFPYPLDGLTGRIHIEAGRLDVSDLCGKRGNTQVCVSGWARDEGEAGFAIDLDLDASRVSLDATLARALPEAGRRLYEKVTPTGQADVTGRLLMTDPSQPMVCDLKAVVSQASLAIPDRSARIVDAKAVLKILPDFVEVESLDGTFGKSPIQIQARVPLTPDDPSLSLHLTSERMVLSDVLRDALPGTLPAVWDSFQPAGVAGLDVRYERSISSSQPADGAKFVAGYSVTIAPVDCQVLYKGFPLPLQNVAGRVVVTPGKIQIDRITARHEQTSFDLAGVVDLLDDRTEMSLRIDAKNVIFEELLRQAVPWRLRRLWNDVKPAGRANVRFKNLSLTLPADGPTRWSFDGVTELDNMTLTMGAKLTEITGRLEASGQVGEKFALSGSLDWPRAKLDGRLVTGLKARFARPPGSDKLSVEDIVGQFYKGVIVGRIEIDERPRGNQYGLTLTARDVSLGAFLNAKRLPGESPIRLKGIVEGNLALAGGVGDFASRRGGGTVLIHDAQMMKVPFMLAMMQVIHLAIDDNAFHDARLTFAIDGDQLIFDEVDLRGKSLSMVGAGRVNTLTQEMDLTLLVGSPLRLPRIEVLSELMEGFARELVEVHVQGTIAKPKFRAEIVRSVKKTLETILNARREQRDQ